MATFFSDADSFDQHSSRRRDLPFWSARWDISVQIAISVALAAISIVGTAPEPGAGFLLAAYLGAPIALMTSILAGILALLAITTATSTLGSRHSRGRTIYSREIRYPAIAQSACLALGIVLVLTSTIHSQLQPESSTSAQTQLVQKHIP